MGAPIGPANARKLEALGCESAADMRDLDTRVVRKVMTVMGERLVQELRGVACLDLEEVAATRKVCAVTRSFSDRVEDLTTMEQAIATQASRLGEKLRREGLGTDHVTVFSHTSEHDRTGPQRSVSTVVTLPEASNDTLVLVKAARRPADLAERLPLLQGRRGHDRPPAAPCLAAGDARPWPDRPRAGCRADGCARRLQPTLRARTVVPAAAGFAPTRGWFTKFEMRSPRYTTRLDEIPVVAA
ncbi:Protein UmuC [Methylobacterium mesophilicum]|jgi:DNA polymerase V|nr:Protein UmuC [Methylobacterium mesophilicum]